MLACGLRRAAFVRHPNLFRLQAAGLLVCALFRRHAQSLVEVVPRDPSGATLLDRLELAGVSLLTQVLPEFRPEHRGLAHHADSHVV